MKDDAVGVLIKVVATLTALLLVSLVLANSDILSDLVSSYVTDSDGDGYADDVDIFPYDSLEWLDTDNDGFGDNHDPYPYDYDNDGYTDTTDLFRTHNAGVKFTLQFAKFIDSVDFLSSYGQIYFVLKVDGETVSRMPTTGTWSFYQNTKYNISKEVRFDVPDNRRYVDIELQMNDLDSIFSDVLDIDPSSSSGRALNIRYDLLTQNWTGDDRTGYSDGSYDGTQNTDDDDGAVWYDVENIKWPYNRHFAWTYDNYEFALDAYIPIVDYVNYSRSDIPRWPGSSGWSVYGPDYVTHNDNTIVSLADSLENLASSKGYNAFKKASMVLKFVQHIEYEFDNVTRGQNEFWRYPLETLFDQHGDCEDSSILFAALMEAMGYDAVLLLLPGHCAVGLDCPMASGSYYEYDGKQYYYCETTYAGWSIGNLPPNYWEAMAEIVPVGR
jgi:transglutaminase-like putative cysteine protease